MRFNVDQDISIAKSLEKSFYLDDKYYYLSLDKIFKKSWQFIGHKSQFLGNKIIPLTLLEKSINEPIVLTTKNDAYSVLSNVCTHRGHIISQKKCNNKTINCLKGSRFITLHLDHPLFQKQCLNLP